MKTLAVSVFVLLAYAIPMAVLALLALWTGGPQDRPPIQPA